MSFSKISSKQITTYLIGANVAALVCGYIIRSPELTATADRQSAIRNLAQSSSLDRAEAMQRAQTCILVRQDMPLTDGVAAYFSSLKGSKRVADPKRPMPHNTKVCDNFGNTGVVDASSDEPVVVDIRSMPSEEMTKILETRGLNPKPKKPSTKVKE